ncbi:YetF domain-containing protein [Streptomyces sp. NPDC052015]|uniref:DUF421 domain-containing protein n=1 Tax=Streptomyces sp. NPDC052015 TaxID=3154755 RepID=UPI0034343193
MPDLSAMFTLETPVLELIIRGAVIFLSLLLLMRVTGQRESGGLGLTDVLLVVLIAEATAGGLVGDSHSVTDGLIVVTTILICSVAVDAAAYRFPRFSAVVKARPKTLIEDGRFDRAVMRREFMTPEEVRSQLRLHGIQDPARVHLAYLEPNGMISVLTSKNDESEPPQHPPTH